VRGRCGRFRRACPELSFETDSLDRAVPRGGATDVVARTFGTKLSENLGQPLVVENRPGAGGNIGAELVANAPSDGYTLLVCSPAEIAINVTLYKKLPFDPVRDFAPITLGASAPLLLVVHPGLPGKHE
jgi:tripartite-type tricarboxylate transporter receptor subunit TctC